MQVQFGSNITIGVLYGIGNRANRGTKILRKES